MTHLKQAIVKNDINNVKALLENSPNLIDEKDEDGILMTFVALKNGNFDIVKYIVEYSRASMNIKDFQNKNVLHYGTMSGNLDICKYLVEKVGMSVTSYDINLETPFELAHKLGLHEIEKYYEEIVGAPLSNMYKNPIRTGFYPDPSIVRVNDDYYMVNSSFVYFPCIPISHSKDLINWEIIGHAITNPDFAILDELEGGRGYWAPDISYYNGKFYITATYRLNDTTNVYRKQIVVSSDKPEGPYSKPSIIDEDGIDPSIFNDDDGKRYMLLNRGARIFELNKDATEQISEAEMLFYGDNKRAPEGPHLIKKDDYYYLFLAEGGTGVGHRITVSRSKSLKGNFEPCPYNPIMIQTDENAIIQRCGHGKPVQTQNGQWFMVYLCGRKLVDENGNNCSMLGRETAIDPITWTKDDWPIINNLKGPSALQIKPNLPQNKDNIKDNKHFELDNLFKNWTFVRTPDKDGYYVDNEALYLKSSSYDLSSIKAKNILLTRQTSFSFISKCKMEIPNLPDNSESGVVCYYDENTYIKFYVFSKNDELFISVTEKIDENIINHTPVKIDNSNHNHIYLKTETIGLERSFYFSYDDNDYIKSAYIKNVNYLCDEGIKKGKRFTGAMIGMYSYCSDTELENFYTKYLDFDYQMLDFKINSTEN